MKGEMGRPPLPLPLPHPKQPPPSSPPLDAEHSCSNPNSDIGARKDVVVPMGPPPPKQKPPSSPPLYHHHSSNPTSNPTSSSSISIDEAAAAAAAAAAQSKPNVVVVPMGPPPPKPKLSPSSIIQQQPPTNDDDNNNNTDSPNPKPAAADGGGVESQSVNNGSSNNTSIPYTIPPWSQAPPHPYALEVIKDGLVIDNFNVTTKGAYMFGRVDLCDFVLDHPTISRFHAVLQFRKSGEAYLYDLASTHGTFVNKIQVKKKLYTELHVGDVIRFGHSSRLYIFQGPSELMPAERDLMNMRRAKIHAEMQDREASLLRAKKAASLAEGISWGMAEDAIEEAEEDTEEVTWQTYKGQLTERQEKTRDKIIKRTEKIANMKKEIDAIRVKDISQGGLTQGQQTQIARNEQRIAQILDELESLEETLNESIQESIGARTGKVPGKKKVGIEDEDEESDEDDEFYDRTKKPTVQKGGEQPSIETADSLIAKKEAIMKEMEAKRKLIQDEESKKLPDEGETEGGDALDAYMTGLSSQLRHDTTMQLQKELSTLQSEMDRIVYLLNIADPTGEASKREDSKLQESKSNQSHLSGVNKRLSKEEKKSTALAKPSDSSSSKVKIPEATVEVTKPPQAENKVGDAVESKVPRYKVPKPQWLGAVHDTEMKEIRQEARLDKQEAEEFVDYKDREALGSVKNMKAKEELGIEGAAPGLIIRKRKQAEKPEGNDDSALEQSTSSSVKAEATAADAVALLLKHKRGLVTDVEDHNESLASGVKPKMEKTESRKVLGPEKPVFLEENPDYESWVPPEGQSGDGKTSLNERYGY